MKASGKHWILIPNHAPYDQQFQEQVKCSFSLQITWELSPQAATIIQSSIQRRKTLTIDEW